MFSSLKQSIIPTYNLTTLSLIFQLTNEGRLMLNFPLPPRLARVILSAAKYKCLIETLTVISMLFVSPVFHVPQDKRQEFNEVSVPRNSEVHTLKLVTG